MSTVVERSCGGVLWRAAAGGAVEICLIATRGGTRWQLPKGHASQGESQAEAARREVREETGCDGEVGEDLGEITFWFFAGGGAERKRIKKTVRFFLLRYLSGETSGHDAEVDDAAWFPGDEAAQRLTFDSERRIAALALTRLKGS